MIILILLFWFSIIAILYTVFIYPLILLLKGLFVEKAVTRDSEIRPVDLIIPVCDGEREIERKIINCLELDYPAHSLNIIVVSDGSSDRTVEIAKLYENKGVSCLVLDKKNGKVAAQNKALNASKNEIVVFTDVSILIDKDAMKNIVSNFADQTIGAVSCRDHIQQEAGADVGDALYINYDMLVRNFTTRGNTLIGVTGGFYAVRRSIAGQGWDPAFPPDFYVALKSIKMGYRVVEDERVLAYYNTPSTGQEEIKRKIRTITRGMWALFSNAELLNPKAFGFVSIQLISHKLMRWLTPVYFLTIYFANTGLWLNQTSNFYTAMFYFQTVFYTLTIPSYYLVYHKEVKHLKFIKLPALWIMLNTCILCSWKNFFMGRKIEKWTPTVRT